jgi:hypothetical protein
MLAAKASKRRSFANSANSRLESEANWPIAPHEEHFQSVVPLGAPWANESFSASALGMILQHFVQSQSVGLLLSII